jgi:hypothetical protein
MKTLLIISLLFCFCKVHAQTPCDSNHVFINYLYFGDSIKADCNGCKIHITKSPNKTTIVISPAVAEVPKNKIDTTIKKPQ